MKLIKDIIAKFSTLSNMTEIYEFWQDLKEDIQETALKNLEYQPSEEWIQNGLPQLRATLVRMISDHYATEFNFQLRPKSLRVYVRTVQFKDGRGWSSKEWEVPHFLEEVCLDGACYTTLDILCGAAALNAIADHRIILEELAGIEHLDADRIATKMWEH